MAMIRGFTCSQLPRGGTKSPSEMLEQNKFYDRLFGILVLTKDPRGAFVGTVYDQEWLKYIRENAFALFPWA